MASTAAYNSSIGLLENANRTDLHLVLSLSTHFHACLGTDSHIHLNLLGVEDSQCAIAASR
jgi:hypothetical protein